MDVAGAGAAQAYTGAYGAIRVGQHIVDPSLTAQDLLGGNAR